MTIIFNSEIADFAAATVVIFTLILVTILLLIAYRTDADKNAPYSLKNYNGTVALFKGEEIITVYDGIILSTLPYADRQKFSSGIMLESPDDVQSIIEDYDG